MQIKIICFGQLDKKYFIDAFKDYEKRAKKYASIEVIELREEFNKETSVNKKINSQNLIEKLKNYSNFDIVCLNVKAEIVSTEQLSELIGKSKNIGKGKMIFVIGPSGGYDDDFLKQKIKKISFGNITLPHQLFRIVLVEQIYRAFKIINNEKYHK